MIEEGDEEKGSSVRKEEHMIAGEEEERVECGKKKNVLAEGGGERDERGKGNISEGEEEEEE